MNQTEPRNYVGLMKPLLDQLLLANKMNDRMLIMILVLRTFIELLPEAIEHEGLEKWMPVIATWYIKTFEFRAQEEAGVFSDMDEIIHAEFSQLQNDVRILTKNLLVNNPTINSKNDIVIIAKALINAEDITMDVDA